MRPALRGPVAQKHLRRKTDRPHGSEPWRSPRTVSSLRTRSFLNLGLSLAIPSPWEPPHGQEETDRQPAPPRPAPGPRGAAGPEPHT